MLLDALIITVALFWAIGIFGVIWSWLKLLAQPLIRMIESTESDRPAKMGRELEVDVDVDDAK